MILALVIVGVAVVLLVLFIRPPIPDPQRPARVAHGPNGAPAITILNGVDVTVENVIITGVGPVAIECVMCRDLHLQGCVFSSSREMVSDAQQLVCGT